MNKQELFNYIKTNNIQRILISGRSAVGKSTFAKELENIHYHVIRTDDILKQRVIPELNIDFFEAFKIYRGTAPKEWEEYFLKIIHEEMRYLPVAIDSSISNKELLNKIFSGENEKFDFIYLHPSDLDTYLERIKKRFAGDVQNNEKTLPVWHTEAGICDEINPEIVEEYKNVGFQSLRTTQYLEALALNLIRASEERFQKFIYDGFNVIKVEV
jgi:cytidylate kinase